jgi:methylase of polypeptide subunit release factors
MRASTGPTCAPGEHVSQTSPTARPTFRRPALLKHSSDAALLELLSALADEGYSFTSVTPATHARVIGRRPEAQTLRDVFGWSRPFRESCIPDTFVDLLRRADMLKSDGDCFKSKLRVSSIDGQLFLHSAYPTEGTNSVFFGPDTYRYAALIAAELPRLGSVRRIVDVGAGTGAGGIVAAKLAPGAALTLTDVNSFALRLAAINAAHAGVDAELVEGSGLDEVTGAVDLVIANPPYIMDEDERAYRDGGDMHGAQLSYDWALAGAKRLQPGGHMILYTGVAIVEGRDELRAALEQHLPALGCSLAYRELDPDVFGEELEKPPYRDVERIAAIAAIITRG